MDHERDLRLSSTLRGVFIAVLIGVYGWVSKEPLVSWKASFLIAAGLQLVVIVIRRVAPPGDLARTIYLFEMIADGVTVLLFALGVFGSLAKVNSLV